MLGYIITFAVLAYSAVKDYRERIIPNWCGLVIICCAILNIGVGYIKWWESLAAAVILFSVFVASAFLQKTPSGVGGGDIKLTTALSMLLGFDSPLVILVALLMLIIICKARNYKSFAFAVCVLLSYSLYLAYFILLKI